MSKLKQSALGRYRPQSCLDQILDMIEKNYPDPLPRSAMKERLHHSPGTIDGSLAKLQKMGLIRQDSYGLYVFVKRE